MREDLAAQEVAASHQPMASNAIGQQGALALGEAEEASRQPRASIVQGALDLVAAGEEWECHQPRESIVRGALELAAQVDRDCRQPG